MRFSITSQVLYGAAVASALNIPNRRLLSGVNEGLDGLKEDLQKLALPLDVFGQFDTMTLEEAQAGAAADNGTNANNDELSSPASTDEFTAQAACANPRIRVEWRNMRDADKLSFVNAVKCLMERPPSGNFSPSQSKYEDLVAVHQRMTDRIHMSGLFLPWHRYYTWVFSGLLREECGYTAPLPWWDEVRDAGNFAGSGLFTDEYFGDLPPANGGQGTCIENGAFGGTILNIGPGASNTPHCLARAVDERQTANVNQAFVDSCNSRSTYSSMESCSEMGPHAYGHNGIGAVMAAVSGSPGDPVFFLHHGFVDRMWRKWQIMDDSRLRDISGCATPGDNCEPLTRNTVLSSMGLRREVTVGQILDIYEPFLCYLYDY
ncbi:hypothetical protein DL769_003894 [Monosporascus sp. CRB-8-3]|nr:hypothetical protein DL769_003894 [Monosporascus sp. CRB-8-3]